MSQSVTSPIMQEPGVTSAAPIQVNKWFEASKFNLFHLKTFIASLVLNTMEGYDMFVLGAALPLLMKALKLSPNQAGAIASAAALGTLVGSVLLGPVADKAGRRKIILWSVVLACASMAAAGLSHGMSSFWMARLAFGIANGALVLNIFALVSEYVPGRSRATMVGLIAAGFPFGGMIGSLLGIWAFPRYGWRPVFLVASGLVILLPLYRYWLPEGSTFLARNNKLNELRGYLRKARPSDPVSDDAVLQVDAGKGKGKVPLIDVFKDQRAAATLIFWLIYAVNTFVNYGFSFWLPKLMMNKGFSLSKSLTFMLSLSISSIVMTFVAGRIVDRIGPKPVVFVLLLLSCFSIIAIGYTHNYALLMVLVGLAGCGFNGAQNMMNAYAPSYYPPSMRSTAMSYNFILGRVGGILGPMAVGMILTTHTSVLGAMFMLAIPSILAAAGIAAISEKYNYTRKLAAAA